MTLIMVDCLRETYDRDLKEKGHISAVAFTAKKPEPEPVEKVLSANMGRNQKLPKDDWCYQEGGGRGGSSVTREKVKT